MAPKADKSLRMPSKFADMAEHEIEYTGGGWQSRSGAEMIDGGVCCRVRGSADFFSFDPVLAMSAVNAHVFVGGVIAAGIEGGFSSRSAY